MKTINVSEATGPVLNWLVAVAEGFDPTDCSGVVVIGGNFHEDGYSPSTDWSQGGPIIEREGILFQGACDGNAYNGWIVEPYVKGGGATHLIAAMRCFVASKLGETAEVPEELTL